MPCPPRAVTISAVSWIVSGRRVWSHGDTFLAPFLGLPFAPLLRPAQYPVPPASPLAPGAEEPAFVPATLTQRFGTKRGLLLALCRTAPGAVPQQFAAARAKYASPLKAPVELYVECTSFAPTPEAMANGLAYLQIDLTDHDFHAITLAQFRALRQETQKLLDAAVAAPHFRPASPPDLPPLLHHLNASPPPSRTAYHHA